MGCEWDHDAMESMTDTPLGFGQCSLGFTPYRPGLFLGQKQMAMQLRLVVHVRRHQRSIVKKEENSGMASFFIFDFIVQSQRPAE